MKKSIKTRLVGNFMLIIIITVCILEMFLINAEKHYSYKNLEDVVTNQIKLSSDFYDKYFSMSSLESNVLNNVDVFWEKTTSEVQIIDMSGNVLMDSIGAVSNNVANMPDVKKAIGGELGKWIGNVDYDDVEVMAISYPLKYNNKVIGVLRFITSLREVNREIRFISYIYISIGLLVILISGVLSYFLANTIVKPLEEVTKAAEKMASGQLSSRSTKKYDDEIGKLSDTLNSMAEELSHKDELKNEFISSVSHELRTPLTSIKGWAITLNTTDLDDKELLRDGLDIIEKESDRLTGMVEELLDFSRFVSNKITLRVKNINIVDVIEKVKKQLEPRAKREKINFVLEKDDDSIEIMADENRIKQVLINVIDNAFKFTPENGEVKITVKNKQEYVNIAVKDTGSGISKEDLPRVKEKFFKGKSSKSQNGLGLSISDEIVKLHNGTMDIYSEIDKGTEVVIKLPLKGDEIS
ncbi:MAG TPA: two-component sensor histidine kinase [Clostridiaceae bacterium]|jgi:signal transduction histidine kinase|nr:two-component sensor histidine kinase [Clostridiaceae bacterium]HBF78084.1 two-component sensor histidine kinase [Clostridiaceae bacterium]